MYKKAYIIFSFCLILCACKNENHSREQFISDFMDSLYIGNDIYNASSFIGNGQQKHYRDWYFNFIKGQKSTKKYNIVFISKKEDNDSLIDYRIKVNQDTINLKVIESVNKRGILIDNLNFQLLLKDENSIKFEIIKGQMKYGLNDLVENWVKEMLPTNDSLVNYYYGMILVEKYHDFNGALKYLLASYNNGYKQSYKEIVYVYEFMGMKEKAIALLKAEANGGNIDAMCFLGQRYRIGEGFLPPNDWKVGDAMRWYKKATDFGNGFAMIQVGYMYENGIEVEKDIDKALVWYQKAAIVDYKFANIKIGDIYKEKQQYEKAIFYYKLSLSQGTFEAAEKISYLFEMGLGVNYNIDSIDYYNRW